MTQCRNCTGDQAAGRTVSLPERRTAHTLVMGASATDLAKARSLPVVENARPAAPAHVRHLGGTSQRLTLGHQSGETQPLRAEDSVRKGSSHSSFTSMPDDSTRGLPRGLSQEDVLLHKMNTLSSRQADLHSMIASLKAALRDD